MGSPEPVAQLLHQALGQGDTDRVVGMVAVASICLHPQLPDQIGERHVELLGRQFNPFMGRGSRPWTGSWGILPCNPLSAVLPTRWHLTGWPNGT